MLDRADFEPVFFAPFVSSVMTVEPAWIDFNGHLNMAYYNVLFDRGLDELYNLAGLGQRYLQERKHSFFTAEVHIRYLRELQEGAPVRVTFQLPISIRSGCTSFSSFSTRPRVGFRRRRRTCRCISTCLQKRPRLSRRTSQSAWAKCGSRTPVCHGPKLSAGASRCRRRRERQIFSRPMPLQYD
ncbi:thioesterase family protein [Pseudorhodoplanes sinuspersici]|uniref:Thioesterase domain-containing protein n=1 Tax=Pseudorhodoplanes sinuspersici TaxID=1235591 RepID=A0A1W6ZRY9_9HYPH|nr:thioesterase family protein [Pseudorhodoplanes sinuspersici]ARQ00157.1 hypothetical protein CAK95_14525 [Pseudorhodoplanes sinuspersici]